MRFECNFSCPHGLPERRMGSAMGENPEILEEVCGWVMSAAKVPVWAKMTPNVTHIEDPSRAALHAGCQGISAINTIRSVIGVNLETLAAGADRRRLHDAGRLFLQGRHADRAADVHGNRQADPATNFPADRCRASAASNRATTRRSSSCLGCDTVQVCTYVMKVGYRCVHEMLDELAAFMDRHGSDARRFQRATACNTSRRTYDLVQRQAAARQAGQSRRSSRPNGQPIKADHEWRGDEFVKQTDALARG